MELNKLTQSLFEQGYTKGNHPDYVRPFNEFYGGFEYTTESRQKLLFETPCGLQVAGSHFIDGGMSYNGVDWTVENHNPVINCPLKKENCLLKSELLREPIGGGLCKFCFCDCRKIDGVYDYEKSIDKVFEAKRKEEEQRFEAFSAKKKGRVCKLMCHYDEWKGEWTQIYEPLMCANNSCSYCSILQRSHSNIKGNVFYDILTKTQVERGEGFLFESKIETRIIKGKKLLSKNAPIDLCEIIARTRKKDIINKELSRHHADLYFAKYHGKYFEIEVINIRAERRENRDLLSDLRDVSEGITVIHNSDIEAQNKIQKHEASQKSIETRKRKYLKMLSEKPLTEIDVVNRKRIERFIDKEIITWLDIEAAKKANKNKYEQITFESEEYDG